MVNTETGNRSHQIPTAPAEHIPLHHIWGTPERGVHRVCKWRKGISQVLSGGLRKHPRLRMLLSECRSFLYRIYIVLTSKDVPQVPMDFAYLEAPSGCVYENIRATACIQGIEKTSSNRPWATPLDWIAYRDSWESGVQWALGTLGSDSALDSEHKALLISKRT